MDKLDSTQVEQLRAIGAYLYEIRQDQGRSLEEIAAKTYIPLRLLKAIEAGQGQVLPEPVFVQGFIRRYGDALGLDGLELSQSFPVHTATSTTTYEARPEIRPEARPEIRPEIRPETRPEIRPREMAEPSQPTPAPTISLMDAPTPSSRSSDSRSSRPAIQPYWIAGAIAALLLGAIVWGLSRVGSRPDPAPVAQTETLPDELPDEVAPPSPSPSPAASASPSPAASPAVSPSPVAAAQPSPSPATRTTPQPNAPVVVEVSLTGDSWMQVLVDGEVDFEGILKKGTQRTWTADREVTIVAGNAGAVQAAFNDGKAAKMGNLGQVEERTFTANSRSSAAGSSN